MTESGIVDKLNVVLYYADEMGNIIPVQLEMDKLALESTPPGEHSAFSMASKFISWR